MMKDTSVKLNKCCLRHVNTSMEKTLEERLLSRDNVVLYVWYYCCAYVLYVVHVASAMLCA